MDVMDTNPIPFSWMGDNSPCVFERASPEKRELTVWLSGVWLDALDVKPADIQRNGKHHFSVLVDPDHDDKFVERIVKGLV